MKKKSFPYQHGFSPVEQDRLRRQARFAEQTLYRDINFSDCKNILEVGCGVGAQTEILLRRFPCIKTQSIDLNKKQLSAAKEHLDQFKEFKGRYKLSKMNAVNLEFESNSFDGAFLCWVLEHIPSPEKVLAEIRRVLKPGGVIYLTEVMNHTFFLDPYSPNVWKLWMAFNDYQYDNGGDPFIGAKLGNLLTAQGYKDIQTTVKTWHFDNRLPSKRKEYIEFWAELLLSAKEQLLEAGVVTEEVVEGAQRELQNVAFDPNAVFYDSIMQASARVY